MATAKQWKDNPEVDTKAEAWVKVHMDLLMPHMLKVGNAGAKCQTDPKFVDVMKRIDELK